MDRLTRKELKSDRFALEVQHSVEYVTEHRRQVVRWSILAAAVVAIIVAVFVYRNYQHGVREQKLAAATQIINANIGPAPSEYVLSFPTTADRAKAYTKAFTDLATNYPGTDEGVARGVLPGYAGCRSRQAGRSREALQSCRGRWEPSVQLARENIAGADLRRPEASRKMARISYNR